MDKIFSLDFRLNSKILLIIYICYHYKFPLSVMLSFYEYYGESGKDKAVSDLFDMEDINMVIEFIKSI